MDAKLFQMDQVCSMDYFLSQHKLHVASSVIWNTRTSPMAIFLINVPFSWRKIMCRLEEWKCSTVVRNMILALHGNILNEVFCCSTVS